MEKRIEENKDPLTGLYRGINIGETLAHLYTNHADPRGEYYLVCMAISSFSRFNSLCGYRKGDQLLETIGKIIAANYSCGIRVNGDTFLFLTGKNQEFEENPAAFLCGAIGEHIGTEYLKILTLALGISRIRRFEIPGRAVFEEAFTALGYAKNISPGHQAVFFDKKLRMWEEQKKNIEKNMFRALSNEEFKIYVQPKYAVAGNDCRSGEALVRWVSGDLGFIIPEQFIPLFEKNGFIVEIDFFVLTSIFKTLQRQLRENRRVYPISVNQSRATVAYPGYLERLQTVMEQYPIPLEYVQLEITESAMEGGGPEFLRLLAALRNMGFSIALDDFGSGYSSLSSLRSLPVDTLKIDKEFLRESDTSERSRTIIKNIVNMSKDLGITVVCEGVETEDQLLFLAKIGCDYAQGYYCAKPMPLSEYEGEYLRIPG
ncbi:EAL domain-containing protein [Breznakiella homolactica]|uniref:EAL domain-containing protein n=1 Tax=Breznakiella homolactica TaxID=2798577 RepID=A0A7T7XLD8_9SPIR|nr:GGDEF domain-containing phosphodiesterase [Breznakiella homolactica]QQO08347.1 GGDEF domain-containing phosphodiesterase [Breznakiella homolactica]